MTAGARIVDIDGENDLIPALSAIVGAEALSTELAERTFFSTDIASRGDTAEAIVRVNSTEQLSAVVKTCTAPSRMVLMKGAWPSSTPNSPSVPGTTTMWTSSDRTSLAGVTSSMWRGIVSS